MRNKDTILLENAYLKVLNENFPQKEWDECFQSYKALPEKEQFIIKELTMDKLSEERPDEGVGSSDIWHTIFAHWEYYKYRREPRITDDNKIWEMYLDEFENKQIMRAGIRFSASKF